MGCRIERRNLRNAASGLEYVLDVGDRELLIGFGVELQLTVEGVFKASLRLRGAQTLRQLHGFAKGGHALPKEGKIT